MNAKSLKRVDVKVIKYLYHNHSLENEILAKTLNMSVSNLRLSIARINTYLTETGQGRCYIKKEIAYLEVTTNNLKAIFSSLDCLIFSSEERQEFLIADLLYKKNLILNDYLTVFDITRTTISSDIRGVKKFLKKNNLEISSLPFKGLYLKGSVIDKIIFSIKYTFKLLLEKDYDIFFNKIYYKYFDSKREKELRSLTNSIIETINKVYNIHPDYYYKKSIVATLLYIDVLSSQGIEIDKIEPHQKSKQLFTELKKLLLENSNIDKFSFSDNAINLLAYALIGTFPNYSFRKGFLNNDKYHNFINFLKANSTLSLNKEQTTTIIKLLKFFECKKEFNIVSHNKMLNYNLDYNFLNFDLEAVLSEYSINISEEDKYYLILFLKNLNVNNEKILILDITHDCWIGKIIKTQTQIKHPTSMIKLKNLSQCDSTFIRNFNPSLILYNGFNFDEFYPEIHIDHQEILL